MTTAEVEAQPQASPEPVPAAAAGRVPRWAALGLAVAAGGALLLAFPGYGLWWCAPVGVALLAVAVHRRGFWAGTGLGLVAGVAFLVPLLSWTRIVGGAAPWLILSTFEAGFLALAAGAAAWCSPLVDRYRWSWPLLTGALWATQEALRDRYPFGGFPWGRLAFSQADSPLLRYAGVGGAPLVTFLTAVAGGLLAMALWRALRPFRLPQLRPGTRNRRRAPLTGAALLAAAAAVVASGLAVPVAPPHGPAVTVAIVQGNVPRLGLEFNAQRRAVLDNHVEATLDLAARVKAGTATRPDIVVWPENSSDIDPLISEDADARARISQAADEIGVPIVVGTLLEGPGDHLRNVALVWRPGAGPGTMYVKRHPVPFAEYMPWRSFARLVSDRVDLVRSDFVAGDRPGTLEVGPVELGVAICFEVAYDDLVRDTVTGGAQLLAVQTNNADFNPAEAGQQLAMVRLRAVEHGRDAMMVSTVGVSGFVDAHGRVSDATGFNTRAVAVRALRTGTARTLATELGPAAEYMLVGLGVLSIAGAGLVRRRRPFRRGSDGGHHGA
jgi:apolipoprotein N-acyltransferase